MVALGFSLFAVLALWFFVRESSVGMETAEYRILGKELIDFLANYYETIRERKVVPNQPPGFLRRQIPESAPVEGESFGKIMKDVKDIIIPGLVHWQSPHMHAYFPAISSYPSMLGGMLADAFNNICFTWASSPIGTELEMMSTNWLGKMIGLPDEFMFVGPKPKGGGVLQTTVSESTLVCLLAARYKAYEKYNYDKLIISKLVAYCSDQAHSSIEKGALISFVQIRFIESDENFSMRGTNLREAIKEDRKNGLIPFWVCATLGTTGCCAFDNLQEVGEVCKEENVWLHVDAAYAGSFFICPEFRKWLKGIEYAESFVCNPSKCLFVNFDCAAMWVKNSSSIHRALVVNPIYLQHPYSDLSTDYMHWQIPLSKRFRALQLWFVLRSYGITGLQRHLRHLVKMALKFQEMVKNDSRFELLPNPNLSLVCFRLSSDNTLTEKLLKRLNSNGNLHCVPASVKQKHVIRFTVTVPSTTIDDLTKDWKEIQKEAEIVIKENEDDLKRPRERVPLGETKERSHNFSTSLILSNHPMSPKIVNGSFAAMYDSDDIVQACWAASRESSKTGISKQFSLDSHLNLLTEFQKQFSLEDVCELKEDFGSTDNGDLPPHPAKYGAPDNSRINESACPKCGHVNRINPV